MMEEGEEGKGWWRRRWRWKWKLVVLRKENEVAGRKEAWWSVL
jgi:hypothetical protein